MFYLKKLLKRVGIALIVLSVYPSIAYAYLDPGTGSYVFQVLVGTLFGAMFAIKMFWRNIRAFFSGLRERRAKD